MPHVLDHPAAPPDTAAAHFRACLAFEIDCSDVHGWQLEGLGLVAAELVTP